MVKESKKDKFKRLANSRTKSALNKLRLIGNLANRTNYEYDNEDVRKIISAIEDQLRITKALFSSKQKKEFKL